VTQGAQVLLEALLVPEPGVIRPDRDLQSLHRSPGFCALRLPARQPIAMTRRSVFSMSDGPRDSHQGHRRMSGDRAGGRL
jgi:hypothetical protein